MANIASAKKRIRKSVRETLVNRNRTGAIRSQLRQVEEAISGGDKSNAEAAFRKVQPLLMRGVRKHMLHANTASRKLSRLCRRIKGMPV